MNIHITRLNEWLLCRRKGYLAAHYEMVDMPSWAQIGTNIHAAIAHHTDPINDHPPVIDQFSEDIFKHYLCWLYDHTPYAQKAIPTTNWVYENEVPFTVPWFNTGHFMQGHIDSIVTDTRTNQTYLLEYKTTSNLSTRAEQIFNELQPIWYTIAATKMGYKIDKIVYHLILKKVPAVRANMDTTKYWCALHGIDINEYPKSNIEQTFFKQVVIPLDRYDLNVWTRQLQQIVDDYTTAQFHYPHFGHHCNYCQFKAVCNLAQRESTAHLADALLSTDFVLRE